MTKRTSWMGSWRTMLQALWLTMLASLLVACGGAIEAAKQQVEVSLSVPAEVTLAPGGQLSVSASAIARDDSLTGMSWSIEPVTTPAPVSPTSTPSIVNGNCANKTLTMEGNDGKGRCAVSITVPDQTQPTTWRVMASATATKKGSASKSFLLHVRNDGTIAEHLKVETESMVQARSQEITTLKAIATSTQPVSNLQYRWVQHLNAGQTRLVLAGENSDTVRFVPLLVEDLRFSVTATGEVNGKLETATADVLVLVGQPTRQVVVSIATKPAEQPTNSLITLEGSAKLNGADLPSHAEYRWELVSPLATELTAPPILNDMTSKVMSFLPKQAGTYVFKLNVSVLINGQTYTGESVTEVVVAPNRETCGFKVSCTVDQASISLGSPVKITATPAVTSDASKNCSSASLGTVQYTWTVTPDIPAVSGSKLATISAVPPVVGKYAITVTASPVINGYLIDGADSSYCTFSVN